MRAIIAVALAVVLVGGAAAAVDAGPKFKQDKPPKIKLHAKGEAFCPSAALVVGNIVIAPGRCYTIYALRDSRGTFLAFADPAYRIPPGQLVRLGTPAGAKLKGRIFYLVPIRPSVVIVPMRTPPERSLRVMARVSTPAMPGTLSRTRVGVPAPNVVVSFNVRL